MHRLLPWIPDIKDATFVDVQNVSDYFWHNDREYWDLNDFNLAPPWPFFATRYSMPTRIYSQEKGWNDRPLNEGAEMITVFRLVDGIPNYTQLPDRPGKRANTGNRITLPGAKWYYDIMMFPVKGKLVQPPGYFMTAIDERGLIVKQPGRNVRAFFAAQIYREFEVQALDVGLLHVSGLALTFLHSRNIQLLPPEPVPPKRRQPRERPFDSRYHRLKVNAIGQKRERSGEGEPTGITHALHIVRGHFRYYGRASVNGNPHGEDTGKLFGKWEGCYWIAGHASGSAEAGLVIKDYEVISPIA